MEERARIQAEDSIFRARAERLIRDESMRQLLGDAVRQHIDDLIAANAEPDASGFHHDISSNLRQLRSLQAALTHGYQGYHVRTVADNEGSISVSIVHEKYVDPANPGRFLFPPGERLIEHQRMVISRTNPNRLGRSAENVVDAQGFSVQLRHEKAKIDQDHRMQYSAGNGIRLFVGATGDCYSHGTMNTGTRVFADETNQHHEMAPAVNAAYAAINEAFFRPQGAEPVQSATPTMALPDTHNASAVNTAGLGPHGF
jgi:hypothetical protein